MMDVRLIKFCPECKCPQHKCLPQSSHFGSGDGSWEHGDCYKCAMCDCVWEEIRIIRIIHKGLKDKKVVKVWKDCSVVLRNRAV